MSHQKRYKVGDRLFLAGMNDYANGVEVEVMELSDDGGIQKARAVIPDPHLARIGFFEENGEYVIFSYDFSHN